MITAGEETRETVPARRWPSRFNGLRGRMALLLLAVLLLPTGYAIFHAIDQYRHRGELQQQELQRTARLIADHQATTLGNLQTWLEQHARVEQMPVEGPLCNEALAERVDENQFVRRLSLVAPGGRVTCSVEPGRVGTDVSERFWFQRASRGTPFTVSELQSRPDGEATLIVAVPLYVGETWLTTPWSPAGVLAAALDLEAFAVSRETVDFAAGIDVYLVDRLGQRVPPLPWGEDEPDFEALLTSEQRTVELGHADEGTSLLATAGIGFSGMQVVVAMPIDPMDWLRAEVLTPIVLPALMLMLGVVAMFAGTDVVVNRHVERLAEAVRRHRPGSPGLERATLHAPNELGELGARFARLAQELEERERSLERALAQKELLLREVNHRVKNNLQVVASLLRMRARSERTPESRAAIRDAHARIEAIALVHRRIYEEGSVEQVELGVFMGELLDHLRKTIGSEFIQIVVTGSVGGIRLATDRAVSLSLLVTELVINAIEHAFAGRPGGRITVDLSVGDDNAVTLVVADDGIGFEPAAEYEGTGINLAELLARQLGGELRFEPGEPGTRAIIQLPPAGRPASPVRPAALPEPAAERLAEATAGGRGRSR